MTMERSIAVSLPLFSVRGCMLAPAPGVGAADVDAFEAGSPVDGRVRYEGAFDVDPRLWLPGYGIVHTGRAPPSAD